MIKFFSQLWHRIKNYFSRLFSRWFLQERKQNDVEPCADDDLVKDELVLVKDELTLIRERADAKEAMREIRVGLDALEVGLDALAKVFAAHKERDRARNNYYAATADTTCTDQVIRAIAVTIYKEAEEKLAVAKIELAQLDKQAEQPELVDIKKQAIEAATVRTQEKQMIELFFEYNEENINSTEKEQLTTLISATARGELETVKPLIESRANLIARTRCDDLLLKIVNFFHQLTEYMQMEVANIKKQYRLTTGTALSKACPTAPVVILSEITSLVTEDEKRTCNKELSQAIRAKSTDEPTLTPEASQATTNRHQYFVPPPVTRTNPPPPAINASPAPS